MATMTKAQAKTRLKKLAPDSSLRDCPVCGDHIYDTDPDDSWEYVKTKKRLGDLHPQLLCEALGIEHEQEGALKA